MNQLKATPLVTIAIICYNYGEYLKEAVASVQSQTYKNIETIIINDGSTDKTDRIAKDLQKNNSKLKYFKQDNVGVVATRNRAIELANGEYLIQLDADDFLDSNYIEEFVAIALMNNADIVYGDYKMFEGRDEVSDFPQYNFELLKNRNYINISSLVKVESIKDHRFDSNLTKLTHEDWDFFLGLCSDGRVAIKCNGPVLNYRIHTNARNNQAKGLSDQRKYVDMYDYVIGKYSKIYPEKFAYLIGGTFAHWYQEIDDILGDTQKIVRELKQDVQYQINETIQIKREMDEIKNSKMFSYITRLRAIKHKLTNQ